MSNVNKLFEQLHKVPQIPEVVRILINQFNDPDTEIKDIARNVEKEQIISLKVLRLVNSAYFSLPKKIDSIEEAVIMLGLNQIKILIIASGIVSTVPEIEGFNIKQFWLDSFCTATYAKWLATQAHCDENIAFTAGLISGLGTILIHLGQPKEAADIELHIKEGHSRPFLEKMRLGYTTQDVTAELCRQWNFSDELVTSVAQCGEPMLAKSVSKIACAVFIARYLSTCKYTNMLENEIFQTIPVDIAEQLGLPDAFFREHLAETLALESGLDGLLN
ncbi:MAG: HDOD domain-containing protein [Thiotrichaceae bacterium]|nr:HDOD domain-containing protein [Thiotrichaceae bacterium]